MINTNKTDNQKATDVLKEKVSNFAESGHLLTGEYIGKLSRSVYTASKLPEGDDYVAIIGNGTEKSNLDALNTLIEKNIDRLIEVDKIYHLEKSLDILRSRFRDVESYLCS